MGLAGNAPAGASAAGQDGGPPGRQAKPPMPATDTDCQMVASKGPISSTSWILSMP